MANNVIQLKRSTTSGVVPGAAAVAQGELAINLADRRLFTKDGTNAVIDVFGQSLNTTAVVAFSNATLNNLTVNTGITTSNLVVNGVISHGNTTITGFANITSTLQVGGAATINNTLAAGNTTVTGFVNASAGVNSSVLAVGTSFVANTTGAYHTGVVNAATLSIGTSLIANSTGAYHTGVVNAATLSVGTSLVANSTGAYHTGTINAASHTVGTGIVANTTGLYLNNAGQQLTIGTTTANSYIAWPANGAVAPAVTTRSQGTKIVLWPQISATAVDYAIGVESSHVWISAADTTGGIKFYSNTTNILTANTTGLNLNTRALSGVTTVAAGNTTITGFANVSSTLQVTGATTISNTVAAGNTTVTGFVNASAGVNTSVLTVGTSFIANTTMAVVPNQLTITGGGAAAEGGQITLGYGNNLATTPGGQSNNTWNIDVIGGNTGNTPLLRVFAQNGDSSVTAGFNIANTGRMHVGSVSEQTDSTFKVTGTANITGAVTIGGNLTVTGTTTYINTTTLNIGDNIITLNADIGAVAPTENAGIEVFRGTSANVSFYWDETNDRWTSSTNTHITGDLTVGGAFIGNISSANNADYLDGYHANAFALLAGATFTGAVTVSNTIAHGNTTITGFANVSSTLQVGGASSLTGLVQITNQAAINTATPGTANYGLHFTGQTTADYATGITWNGGTGTTGAQAGIYVQGSGSYGTKMYIATTDSYATGARTALQIDHLGVVSFIRARPTYSGYTLLDTGNYNSYALPLAGGTVTGAVTVSNTLSTGNTTVTGFANVSSTLQVGSTSLLNGNVSIRSSAVNSFVDIGSATQTSYTDLQLTTNAGNFQMFLNGTGYSSYGGAGAMNIYTSNATNGHIAFFPGGVATVNSLFLAANGNVGIANSTPVDKLRVQGSFSAVTKSFLIAHPTKPGKTLRHGSLEGPENGVYVRGKITNTDTIELPDYWTELVDADTITVELTSIGKHQNLYVVDVKDNKVVVGNDNMFNKTINCYYTVFAERKDVDKLVVEG